VNPQIVYFDWMSGALLWARARGSFSVQGPLCFNTQSETAFRASGAMVS